jgi:hypothetical protein
LITATTIALDGPGTYSLHETAELLGQDVAFVEECISAGKLAALEVGRRTVVTAPSIVRLLATTTGPESRAYRIT